MKKKILVIDDEENIRNILKIFLEKDKNYKVLEAKDGKEGLEMFKKSKPDVIITDLNMPFMRGEEVVREIKKTSNPKIICTSAEIYLEPVAKAAGCDIFLEKPFDLFELKKIIDEN